MRRPLRWLQSCVARLLSLGSLRRPQTATGERDAVRTPFPRSFRHLGAALLFLLPTIIVLGMFNVYPSFYSFYLSLFEWDGFTPKRTFVGIGNYARLLGSYEFWNSLRVTTIYATGVTLGSLAIGLVVAALLNRRMLGRSFYRTLYFLPVITPTVAAGMVWKLLFDPTKGAVNQLLAMFGISGPGWLSDPLWSLVAVIIVGIWKRVGFNMVVYLAALQNIPRIYYEAAAIDGASAWYTFIRITVPLLMPSTLFLGVTSLIDAFQIFDLVYVMTAGGPLKATDVLGYYLYRYAFRYHELGYACAVAYIILTIIFIITLLQFRLLRRGGGIEG